MSALNACRVCLAENLTMYRVTSSPYEEIYEKLTNAKLGKIYPDTLCYICVSVLRKFQKFATLAQHSNIKLKQWYKKEIECKPTTKPMFTISTTTVEYVSMINTNNDEKMQIKVEQNEDTEEPTTEMQFIEFTNETDPYIEPEDDNDFHNDYDSDADQKPDVARMSSNEEFEVPVVKKEPKKRAVKRTVKAETKGAPVNKKNKLDTSTLAQIVSFDHSYTETKEDSQKHPSKRFICNICNKEFTRKARLLTHAKCHNIGDRYKCDYCTKTFVERKGLQRHNTNLHSDKPQIICNICLFRAVNKNDIFTHKINYHTAVFDTYICDYCQFKTTRKQTLEFHIRRIHLKEKIAKTVSCEFCDYKGNRSSVRRHSIRVHTTEKSYFCDKCEYSCKMKYDLKTHSRVHENKIDSVKDYKHICDVCGKQFAMKSSLKLHLRVHSGLRPYTCETCGKNFSQLCSLKSHIKYIHLKLKRKTIKEYKTVTKSTGPNMAVIDIKANEEIFACEQCDFKCKVKKGLKRHIERKHATDKPYLCHICDYKCTVKEYLKIHLKTHDKNEENYKYGCDVCHRKFTRNNTLIQHKRTHTGEKPYTCPTCGKTFAQQSAMTTHIRFVHKKEQRQKKTNIPVKSEVQKHACGHCDFKCVDKRGLTRHITRMHVREKTYLCDQCHYRCIFFDDLKRHKEKHKNKFERVYKYDCHLCVRKFTTKYGLEKHLITHTIDKSYKCSVCEEKFMAFRAFKRHYKTHGIIIKEKRKINNDKSTRKIEYRYVNCDPPSP